MTLIHGARAQQLLATMLALEDEDHQTFIEDQQAMGLAPRNAVRPLHEHELAAQTRFADLEDDRDAAVREAERLLSDLHENIRQSYLVALFGQDFDGELSPQQAVEVIHALNADMPEDVAEEENSVLLPLAGIFAAIYLLSGDRVIDEADRQGISVQGIRPAALEPTDFLPDALAVSTHPWRRISSHVEEEFTKLDWIHRPAITKDDVERVLAQIKIDGSRDRARQAINRASGSGRLDTVRRHSGPRRRRRRPGEPPAAPPPGGVESSRLVPSEIWASEIMDGAACPECETVDGREYGSLEAARRDYPAGQYRACRGEERCRGTLVFLFR